MRPLVLALCLSTSTTPGLGAPPTVDISNMREIEAPISKLVQPDRHEILHRLQIIASQLRAEAITSSGEQTFLVQGSGQEQCAPVGNCSFWIFDAQHRILLATQAQTVKYLPTIHNNRNDVLTRRHGSATESTIAQWQFDGKRYRHIRCFDVNYGSLDDISYKQPHITSIACKYY